jgi:hypothetical protein
VVVGAAEILREGEGGIEKERECAGGSCNKKREECLGAERGLGRVICKP